MQPTTSWLCSLCAAASLWTLPVAAHAPPQATGIYTSGTERWVRTNRGLIVQSNADEPLRLLCNDAYGASLSEAPPVIATPDGLLLATYTQGVQRIASDGCEARAIDLGLGDREVADLATTADRERYFALVAPSPAQAGAVLASSDNGVTWKAVTELTAFGTAIAVAPSDPQRVYVSAIDQTADGSAANELLVSLDGAASFSSRPFELLASEVRAFVLAIDPEQPDRVFLRTLPGNPEMPERLLLSEDAGKTFSEVYAAVGPLVLTRWDGSWWLGGKTGLFRSNDDGKSFQPTPAAPTYIGCLRGGASGLEVCGYQDNEFGVFRSDADATAFSPELRFGDVTRQVACGDDVVETCRANFEDWLSEVAPANASDGGAAGSGGGSSIQPGNGGSEQGPSMAGAKPSKSSSGCSLGVRTPDEGALIWSCLGCLVWLARRRKRV